ncbi:unnamed protein product [Protopolystoma xenopodis]|uniref:Uncharacterized protein n=1 Tax=Protopolystoma xenopodis TaxID=117903 RepID=A0A3S5A8J4_9PLAT|nr:unnamed protein product [Protopolystoma xenopodis]
MHTNINAQFIFSALYTSESCFDLIGRRVARFSDIGTSVHAHPLDTGCRISPSTWSNRHIKFPQLDMMVMPNATGLVGPSGCISSSGTSGTGSCFVPCDLQPFGVICFKLTASPESMEKPLCSGLLWIRVSSKPTLWQLILFKRISKIYFGDFHFLNKSSIKILD